MEHYAYNDDRASNVGLDQTPDATSDAEKCRNVLVRYCAHIPRNYQYRDGMRLIFLILRNHFGDESLGFAAGVLYELIEIDCQGTDDKGAAYQRWKHDHMNRHFDLKLPHVPHMTTISSPVIPTRNLANWRRSHPERYRLRLSDYQTNPMESLSLQHGVLTRKTWLIDRTMYVSSRRGGTHPFRRLASGESHQPECGLKTNDQGIRMSQRAHMGALSLKNEISKTSFVDTTAGKREQESPEPERRHDGLIRLLKSSSLRRKPRDYENLGPSMVEDCQRPESPIRKADPTQPVDQRSIPNAAFARKFEIYDEDTELPPSLRELPAAEDKFSKAAVDLTFRGRLCSRSLKGPLTPQLWFDSGLDFRWKR